jgi:hypothetical protein
MNAESQLRLDDVPPRTLAHTRDPQTSIDAARLGSAKKASGRRACLQIHATNPSGLIDDEVSLLTGIELHETRRRCTDLRNAGLIEFLSATRPSNSGRHSTVSAITADGWEALS